MQWIDGWRGKILFCCNKVLGGQEAVVVVFVGLFDIVMFNFKYVKAHLAQSIIERGVGLPLLLIGNYYPLTSLLFLPQSDERNTDQHQG